MISMIEGEFGQLGECSVTGFEEFHSENGVDGIVYNYSIGATINDVFYPGTGTTFCFPSAEDNYWFFVIVVNIGDTEYVYDADFLKILSSIQKESTVPAQTGNTNQSTKTSAPSSDNKTQSSISSASNSSGENSSRTVYITRTGSKYHYSSSCNGGTYYPASLSEAKSRGLTPCNKCVK